MRRSVAVDKAEQPLSFDVRQAKTVSLFYESAPPGLPGSAGAFGDAYVTITGK